MGKNPEGKEESRDQIIVKTSIVGIIVNLFLSAFKAMVGLLTGSIAIVLDAVNNLSDALSSVVTIIGTRLANRRADKKHPLGHGRIEYITAVIVSAIVLYAGVTALVESIKKIIHPEAAEYTTVSLIILGVAIVAKILLSQYVKAQGKKAHSGALEASGKDAFFDAILSLSVLASALIYIFTGLSLEAYVGVVISVVIIKAGIEMLLDALNDILGHRADPELVKQIKAILNEEPEVRGAYDLVLNNYGPDKEYASVHLELPDVMTVKEVDELTRRVMARVYQETGVILVGVGVYSYNTSDDSAAHIRNEVQKTVLSNEWALQMHGFYLNEEAKDMRFDVVLDFGYDIQNCLSELQEQLKQHFPDYMITISPDVYISD